MRKLTAACLWVLIAALTAAPGWAEKKGARPPASSLSEEDSSSAQTGDVPEAGELMKQGRALEAAGHNYKALSLYERALQLREKTLGPDHPLTAASMARLARLYSLLSFFDKGLPLAQQSLRIREKNLGPENPQTAQSLMILGFLYGQMGAQDKGLQMTQQALRISEKALGPEHPRTAAALHNLAVLHAQMGAYDQALPLAQRAARIREQALGLQDLRTAGSLTNLGYLYLLKKDYSQAESCFRRALPVKGDHGLVELYLAQGQYESALNALTRHAPKAWYRPQYQALYYTQKGLALQGLGQWQEAYPAFLEAIKNIEGLRGRTSGERTGFFESGLLGGYSRAYRGLVEVLAQMAQKGEPLPQALQTYGPDAGAAAFYFAESIKARSLLEAMAAGAARESFQLPPDLAAREKSLQERLAALEAQRPERLQERGKGWDRQEQPAEQFHLEIETLQKKQQELVAELRRRQPRYAALRYPQPYKAQELPLKPGEVLVEYALGDKQSYLFRVEPGGKTQVFRIPLGQEALEKRLGAILSPFRQDVLRREDLSRFSVSEAAKLYGELLKPALAGVAPKTHLIIVPDGVLGAFPFEALAVEAGPGWDKSVLVGDRWAVSYSQSAAILVLNRHLGATHASKALFALGDPIFDQASSRYLAFKSGKEKAGELKSTGPEKALTMSASGVRGGRLVFPPLPETRKTVEDLAGLFGEPVRPPGILLDVQATETRVRHTPLAQYRYLFFGTHGFMADNLAGVREPTLVLTQVENKPPDNGFLTFSKVMHLKLDADLVTLAACMTGVGQVMQGEGVLNFARAFQQAGSRSVMVSLWNIPVDESLKFYAAFYKALKEGKPKIEALKAARQVVRSKEPHPYFWSGLILHGEG
ncbi:MAG: CHAT domain-containing tetratricopeptide repeat protein [Thermodesulfobacteriota bacterium]